MTQQQVLNIIRTQFRASRLPPPDGLEHVGRESQVWLHVARQIVTEVDNEKRTAVRHPWRRI